MTDRPIIFSAPMVKALLDGRKNMTRRMTETRWQKVKPGDRLWVRENLAVGYWPRRLWFSVDETNAPDGGFDFDRHYPRIAVPSIYMPRWASRLTLVVTATKIERVQEISEADAKAEGVEMSSLSDMAQERFSRMKPWPELYRPIFSLLWRDLHGDESWNANPEVCAISFQVIQKNIDAMQVAE